ncbi:hypothetical protein BT67DRAFT_96942 [Trichocladium antarcticum]|uniref:Uncharacterized protein n=1 Tax=Trichocladium antarcticum TaxID=1450529 RepID=A0AAN6UQ54_9PEZI|nr:hypothetical protein BT67DRAFT_96942 [Trichocladium antarcticum]
MLGVDVGEYLNLGLLLLVCSFYPASFYFTFLPDVVGCLGEGGWYCATWPPLRPSPFVSLCSQRLHEQGVHGDEILGICRSVGQSRCWVLQTRYQTHQTAAAC